YIGIYIVGTVLLVPGTVLSFVGAALFGVWEGTLYTWIGATLGATAAFFLAKALGRDFVNQRLGGKLEALDRRLAQNGFASILILRLVPLFPFNGINFGSGLTSIRAGDYILGTAVGILPGTFVFQFVFDRLAQKLGQESLSWEDWLDPVLGLALLLFVGFVLLGRWLSKKLQSRSTQHSA
ncbi:MAG: TVP38/TMEM64 family protein, partial [Gemmataceae bacterium]|nr:TVP38/TMEM64 family protein [Gemmataceae bacterium]